MTIELIQGLLLAFALVVILMPPYIRLLQHAGFDGPALAMDAYAFAAPDAVRVGPLVVSP